MSTPGHSSATRKGTNAESNEPARVPVLRVRSHDLLRDGQLIIIEHAGHEYRLSVTRQNKLILTK